MLSLTSLCPQDSQLILSKVISVNGRNTVIETQASFSQMVVGKTGVPRRLRTVCNRCQIQEQARLASKFRDKGNF